MVVIDPEILALFDGQIMLHIPCLPAACGSVIIWHGCCLPAPSIYVITQHDSCLILSWLSISSPSHMLLLLLPFWLSSSLLLYGHICKHINGHIHSLHSFLFHYMSLIKDRELKLSSKLQNIKIKMCQLTISWGGLLEESQQSSMTWIHIHYVSVLFSMWHILSWASFLYSVEY